MIIWRKLLGQMQKSQSTNKHQNSQKSHPKARNYSMKGQGNILVKNKWGYVTLGMPVRADGGKNKLSNKPRDNEDKLGESLPGIGANPGSGTKGESSTSKCLTAEPKAGQITRSEEESNF